ncbi:hypothetical protein CkaCkLH20_01703 [Colletotrichum karsti]|uniref:Uncharacterized protein n=1 Tax=Colletotrichum karsti TaxID=1095194 RepID=A0A9P6IEZ0_9PEZI|nr:uncharacterized protein CkaCkLH20_01703 [Colletotrichum karsti]KAF9880661.1 hypothetical protein CkaCkLH20_01703 [Colletotrichum karsti]
MIVLAWILRWIIKWIIGMIIKYTLKIILKAILGPILVAFGFGPLGPIAGTIAAWWQAWYGGFVPAGSVFSFFQWLAMVIL